MSSKLMKVWLSMLVLTLVLHLVPSVSLAEEGLDGTDGQVDTGETGDDGDEDGEESPVGAPMNAAQRAKVDNLANAVAAMDGTVTASEIESMRAAGMGWGEIAHALGVHPGTLGLGQKLGHAKRHGEMAQMTTRSMTGKAKGHGVNSEKGPGGRGLGQEKSKGLKGEKENRGNSGNAGGKGNSGNAGGNGKGGGKK